MNNRQKKKLFKQTLIKVRKMHPKEGDESLLTTVFKNGELVREDTFEDIRNRMYGGK